MDHSSPGGQLSSGPSADWSRDGSVGGWRPRLADDSGRSPSFDRRMVHGWIIRGRILRHPMTSANPPIPAPRRELEPTHPCIRCGREGVPADAGLCELCNPLELSQPAATQMHGIAALGIVAFVAVLAVVGRAVIAGIGPFDARIAGRSEERRVGEECRSRGAWDGIKQTQTW